LHIHTSPNVRSEIVRDDMKGRSAHPEHVAVAEKLPPAACGGSTTFQLPSSATGLDTDTGSAAAPPAAEPESVTETVAAPGAKAPGVTAPYSAAPAGARCRTAESVSVPANHSPGSIAWHVELPPPLAHVAATVSRCVALLPELHGLPNVVSLTKMRHHAWPRQAASTALLTRVVLPPLSHLSELFVGRPQTPGLLPHDKKSIAEMLSPGLVQKRLSCHGVGVYSPVSPRHDAQKGAWTAPAAKDANKTAAAGALARRIRNKRL
jgi:hypothetical protein